MRTSGHSIVAILLLLAVVGQIGCSSQTKAWRLHWTATDRINPTSETGASGSVKVWVYQLKSKEKFQHATCQTLSSTPPNAFGSDALGNQFFMAFPSKEGMEPLEVNKEAAYFAIMAEFEQCQTGSWKQLVEAKSSVMNPLTPTIRLVIDRNTIKLAD